ncbi:MAG: hypothetical protein ACKVX7_10390 [Planctomycetota bacterium]
MLSSLRSNVHDPRRSSSTFGCSVVLTAGILFVAASRLDAHGFEIELKVFPDRYCVEAYFPIDGSQARDAQVAVYGVSDELLASGATDASGRFCFTLAEPRALRITAEHVEHRATLSVTADELLVARRKFADGADSGALVPRSPRWPIAEAFAGVALILALASFFLCWRLRGELDRLRAQLPTPQDANQNR